MAGNPTTPQPTTRVLWRPEQFNRVSNPGFETNTTGWSVSAGINAAGTSVTRITTDSHSGSACASVVCTSTDTSGVRFDLGSDRYYVEASYGCVYVATVWLKRTSGSRRARVILGSEGTSADRATLTITDLTDSWAPYTVRWLPSANRTDAQLAVTNGSAEALTFKIDDVTVYAVDAFSQVENGTFPVDTTGWDIGASYITVAATSLTRLTSDGFAPSVQTCAELVTTSSTGSGADYPLGTRLFTSGRTYRARVAIKRMGGGGIGVVHLGSNGTGADRATSGLQVLTTSWAWYTVDWTPSADRTDAVVAVSNNTSSGAVVTMRIGHVEVYETADDLGTDVQSLRWTRSTEGIGTIACQVLNHDGTYDPRNASAALYGSLSPGKRIWGRATYGGALYPLFYGTLTTIEAPPLGGIHTDLVAEDMLGFLRDADAFMDFDQTDTYAYARSFAVSAAITGISNTNLSAASQAHVETTVGVGIETNTFYNGTDGDTPALDYLSDLNEATGTAHHVLPSVEANIGWVYTVADRATLTDTSSDFSIDEDFEDLTGVRLTHEALENRQEVPWQAYEKLPPPGAGESGYGLVMVARDPAVITYADSEDPYLHYTDDEYGTDDDHPDPRWRLQGGGIHGAGWKGWKRWRQRRRRGLRVKRRTRVYRDAAVPFTMVAGENRRYIFDFALPVSGLSVGLSDESDAIIWYGEDEGTNTIRVEYIESRPNRLVVDLVCETETTVANLEVFGTPWLPLDDLSETVEGHASQAAYGPHAGPGISTAYIPSRAAAEGIGNYRNWRYGDPRLRPTLHLGVGQLATIVAVDPTDHITLSADRWRIDALLFAVRGATWEVVTKGMEWSCQVDLEELPAHTDWFVLDSSELDGTDILAY